MASQNVAWTTLGTSTGSLRTMEMSSAWRSSWRTWWSLSEPDCSWQVLGVPDAVGVRMGMTLPDVWLLILAKVGSPQSVWVQVSGGLADVRQVKKPPGPHFSMDWTARLHRRGLKGQRAMLEAEAPPSPWVSGLSACGGLASPAGCF